MKKIWNHLKDDWFKYLAEIGVVVLSILLAFALNEWSQDRNEKEDLKETYRLIAEEIKWDLAQVNTSIANLEKAQPYFDKLIAGTMTETAYQACKFCPTLSTSRYPIKSSYNGWKNLTKKPHFQISRKDTLNYILDDYYYDLNVRAAKEMQILGDDIMENTSYFKFNEPNYHKLASDPQAMMKFHLESPVYRNMLSVRRHSLYDRYLITLKGLKKDADKALEMISRKYPLD
ncbi:MAG: hypothetical protein Roseis2KO_31810 [Roseivirga sp.]